MAERKNVTPPQIALGWLLAQKSWIVPIRGTKEERVVENPGALDVQLDAEDLRQIETAAAEIQVQGARLPEAVLQYSNR
jgi:aryl-alcohol dehydrogenase-like predicted oxidoreductase